MEELINALRTIKEECKKHQDDDSCCDCPMGTYDGGCCVTDCTPDNWSIVQPTYKIMR